MAVNETIVTGRKWRRCIDVANKLWQRISYWTKASDVEYNDGKTAETKNGAIDGITDSLVSTSSRIAASAKAINQLNNNLKGVQFITDATGKITGYKTEIGGADTVFPFMGNFTMVLNCTLAVGDGTSNISGANWQQKNTFDLIITCANGVLSYDSNSAWPNTKLVFSTNWMSTGSGARGLLKINSVSITWN